MNLTEYLNQKDPVRLPSFSVEVKRSELYSSVNVENGQIVTLKYPVKIMGNDLFQYYVPDEGTGMWVMDQYGKPRDGSCFKLID